MYSKNKIETSVNEKKIHKENMTIKLMKMGKILNNKLIQLRH